MQKCTFFTKIEKTENLNKKHENLENAKMDIFHHFEQKVKKMYKIWISMLPSLDKTEDQIWIHPDFQLKSPTLISNQVTMFKTLKSG